MAQRERFELS